jgi:DNA primase small subunit
MTDAAVGPSAAFLTDRMKDFYRRVFPVPLIAEWFTYGGGTSYMARREVCFTLVGDIFVRFKSFAGAAKLRDELVRSGPEKIDIGAVYQVTPDKRHTIPLVAQERELVFDIDMSDYDPVRSCCKGKRVCRNCWPWMSTAVHILRYFVSECFGFQHMLPVFSGRRGIHLWVCDEAARKLTDDERHAVVGYMTVVTGEFKLTVMDELKRSFFIKPGTIGKPELGLFHPTMHHIAKNHLTEAFKRIFLSDDNDNCIFTNADSAAVVYRTLLGLRAASGSNTQQENFCPAHLLTKVEPPHAPLGLGAEPQPLPMTRAQWDAFSEVVPVQCTVALCFALLYPRLDEHVSTRRDHLLKLPLCVHPGTGRLCAPLEWDEIDAFDPTNDPPHIDQLLLDGAIPSKWLRPLERLVAELAPTPSATMGAADAVVSKSEAGIKAEVKMEQ